MQIGLFTVLFQDLPFEQALDRAVASGVSAVEVGTGGYPGNHHCPLEDLLESSERRQDYLHALARRHLRLSALSCQYEPLHPDATVAGTADRLFRQTVELASLLSMPVVNVLSGLPAGAPGDSSPNWITCPWPPHFLTMLDYQWNQIAIPHWRAATRFAADHGVKVACEMHPGMLVYLCEKGCSQRLCSNPDLQALSRNSDAEAQCRYWIVAGPPAETSNQSSQPAGSTAITPQPGPPQVASD